MVLDIWDPDHGLKADLPSQIDMDKKFTGSFSLGRSCQLSHFLGDITWEGGDFLLLQRKWLVSGLSWTKHPHSVKKEDTFTYHFQSSMACCTIVNSMVSILSLRAYFWHHIFNIFIQDALHVTQEWCSWKSAYASAFHTTLLLPETSLSSREFKK